MDEPEQEPTFAPIYCAATVMLSPAERRQLYTLPEAANMVEWQHQCWLEDAHQGPHHALGQAAGAQEHWIRWDEDRTGHVDLVALSGCGHSGPEGEHEDPCILFAGHPGAHQIGPRWERNRFDHPPQPDPAGGHAAYLAHRRASTETVSSSTDPAQVHATLATAAALNRIADLMQQRPTAQE